jgi:hypothetical protein
VPRVEWTDKAIDQLAERVHTIEDELDGVKKVTKPLTAQEKIDLKALGGTILAVLSLVVTPIIVAYIQTQ